MRPFSNIKRRLASSSGETLVETLVSILISSLALLMLAGAISAAVNIVRTSRTSMEEFYEDVGEVITGTGDATSSAGTVNLGVTLDTSSDKDYSKLDVIVYEHTDEPIVLYEEAS